ncbi:hypothetical protein M0R72_16680 [Candidatus Pacearchaeota archaeon]|jgi:hypothetical protein|nr:hypothetical protein [Candidatus Pacearchaeota archaeon]
MDRLDKNVGCGILAMCFFVLLVVLAVLIAAYLIPYLPQVHQIVDTTLPGAYESPPTPVHDVYAIDVVGADGGQTTLIEVEVPWSTHSRAVLGWYRVPLTLMLPDALP